VTVAMMRAGDKLDSYRLLAEALARLGTASWRLAILGDGPERAAVQALFARFGADRIDWHGECAPAAVAEALSQGALYVWPGCGEAYGLAYLEAQAAGLPVVAQALAGVPEVVTDGVSGRLTAAGDIDGYAAAIDGLLADAPARCRLAAAARQNVIDHHSIDAAADRLDRLLRDCRERVWRD